MKASITSIKKSKNFKALLPKFSKYLKVKYFQNSSAATQIYKNKNKHQWTFVKIKIKKINYFFKVLPLEFHPGSCEPTKRETKIL
jgi:hypothetical protein